MGSVELLDGYAEQSRSGDRVGPGHHFTDALSNPRRQRRLRGMSPARRQGSWILNIELARLPARPSSHGAANSCNSGPRIRTRPAPITSSEPV
jgi:hypothetical protein